MVQDSGVGYKYVKLKRNKWGTLRIFLTYVLTSKHVIRNMLSTLYKLRQKF